MSIGAGRLGGWAAVMTTQPEERDFHRPSSQNTGELGGQTSRTVVMVAQSCEFNAT